MLSCAAPRNPGQVVGSRGLAASASAAPVVHKISAAPMVYVSGEEMTRYTMQLVLDKWVHPHVDTSKWDFYDLRAKNRDDTEDQVHSPRTNHEF